MLQETQLWPPEIVGYSTQGRRGIKNKNARILRWPNILLKVLLVRHTILVGEMLMEVATGNLEPLVYLTPVESSVAAPNMESDST